MKTIKRNYRLKRSYSFMLIGFYILFSSCSTKSQKSKILKKGITSAISFEDQMCDFGKIPAKKEATAIFKFSNTGNNPLIITEVKTSCGCTVPEYSKEPIKPNEKGGIKVVYDAKYPGRFKKTITVFYNGKDSPKTLTIKGEVPYPKELDSIN